MRDLERLAEQCVVRVASGSGFGSGFWVAPNLVLTCAHVASAGTVEVLSGGRVCPGRVVKAEPAGGLKSDELWPLPDLALIEVADPGEHPCVWLNDAEVDTGGRLQVLGLSEIWSSPPQPDSALGHCGGRAAAAWRFVGDAIEPGMSGGPVISLGTWAVCGVVKASRRPGTDMGGLVTPLSVIRSLESPAWREMWRSHDAYHGTRGQSRWPALRHKAVVAFRGHATSAVDVLDEAALLGVLSAIPLTEEPVGLYRAAMGRAARTDLEPMADLRDVALALAATITATGQLHPLLRFTADLSIGGGADAAVLRAWAEQAAWRRGEHEALNAHLGSPVRAAGTHLQPMIWVRIIPGGNDPSRYHLSILADGDDGQPTVVYCDDTAIHGREDLAETLAQPIMSALKMLRGNAVVAFLIPTELYDVDFENLSIGRSRLGRMAPVVLCDLERLASEETWHDWHERWKHLQSGTGVSQSLACGELTDPDQFDVMIRNRPQVATLVLSQPPTGRSWDLLDVALYAGMPAAVWPRHSCDTHDDDHDVPSYRECSGSEFVRRFQELSAQDEAIAAPRLVRHLRLGRTPGMSRIVLLWDDPTRIVPDADLVEPLPPE